MTLRTMFTNIARTYDAINFIITFGLYSSWRRSAARNFRSSGVTLDLCCGTGGLSRDISRFSAKNSLLVGLDFSIEMLLKALHQKIGQARIRDFILADAGNLPFQGERIDYIGISFSFRNLIYDNSRAELYLEEILRVTRYGGKFVVVETSQPTSYPLRIALHFYLGKIVPLIGGLISRNKDAYRYLGISAMNFYSAENVREILRHSGFERINFKSLAFGIAAIHVSIK
jgi:demethylmenaquinone methyltransferase/2-methoxy-6-polyprenyl-1,4-benzoquinol methylase